MNGLDMGIEVNPAFSYALAIIDIFLTYKVSYSYLNLSVAVKCVDNRISNDIYGNLVKTNPADSQTISPSF